MKIQLPPWVAIAALVVVLAVVGVFAVKKIDDGTVGSVTVPGPPSTPQGAPPSSPGPR